MLNFDIIGLGNVYAVQWRVTVWLRIFREMEGHQVLWRDMISVLERYNQYDRWIWSVRKEGGQYGGDTTQISSVLSRWKISVRWKKTTKQKLLKSAEASLYSTWPPSILMVPPNSTVHPLQYWEFSPHTQVFAGFDTWCILNTN